MAIWKGHTTTLLPLGTSHHHGKKTTERYSQKLTQHLKIHPFPWITPWKFNIATENIPSQKENSLPTIIFQGRAVKLPEGYPVITEQYHPYGTTKPTSSGFLCCKGTARPVAPPDAPKVAAPPTTPAAVAWQEVGPQGIHGSDRNQYVFGGTNMFSVGITGCLEMMNHH